MLGNLWKRVTGLFAPTVSDEQLQSELARIKEASPVPVFWLLGKTQAGKTSVVRFLTGAGRAEVGKGFQPCTRYSSLYDYPTQDAPLLRFLDTRGLDEPGYDPAEDLARFGKQAHVVLVVVRLHDHALESLTAAVRAIRADRPDRPVALIVTTLHEAYPQQQHPTPYPFDQQGNPLPGVDLPPALLESLEHHKKRFAGLVDRAIPIDLTPPEEGFDDRDYGGDRLRQALMEMLPEAQAQTLRSLDLARAGIHDLYERRAMPTILAYSSMAATAGAVPVPVVDLALIAGVQTGMLNQLARMYGQPLDSSRMRELAGALGVGLVARSAGRSLIKAIPVVGSVLGSVSGAVLAGAATYALGRAFCHYYRDVLDGKAPDIARLKAYFNEQFEAARARGEKKT
jgi:uncharacterized protein (DUF697 family)/predicted GTPase